MLCIWLGNAQVGSGAPSPLQSMVKPVTWAARATGRATVGSDAHVCGDVEPADDALLPVVVGLHAAGAGEREEAR